MPKSWGYKDKGDRVVVINAVAYGLPGVVQVNDGFGEVWVALDDGRTFHGYEGADLVYEQDYDEKNPPEPVKRDSGPDTDSYHEIDQKGNRSIYTRLTGGEVY